jgi:hypothetical protein
MFIGYGYMAPIKNCYEHIPKLKGNQLSMQAFVVEFVS